MNVEVGKKYYSKCDNIIEIHCEKVEEDADGHPYKIYAGRVIKTIRGHEILAGRLHKFLKDGRWINDEGKTIDKCIHDLRESLPYKGVQE